MVCVKGVQDDNREEKEGERQVAVTTATNSRMKENRIRRQARGNNIDGRSPLSYVLEGTLVSQCADLVRSRSFQLSSRAWKQEQAQVYIPALVSGFPAIVM